MTSSLLSFHKFFRSSQAWVEQRDKEAEQIRAEALLKSVVSGYWVRPNPDMKRGEEKLAQLQAKLDPIPTAEVWRDFAHRLKGADLKS